MPSQTFEPLLHPPIAGCASLSYGLAGGLFFVSPHLFLLPPLLNCGLGISLIALSAWRFRQGWHVWRYQRHLRRLPAYALSSAELPHHSDQLFLGQGFRWEAKHTQRLYMLKQKEHAHWLQPSRVYQMARRLERQCAKRPSLQGLSNLLASQNRFNPVRPLPPLGGALALHGVECHEKPIFLNQRERVGHTMILGTTRVGKTRLLELLIASDIRRKDSAVIVFDPKGDLDLLKRLVHEAEQVGRAHEVIVFHLGYPHCSARYNPIGSFARITEVANRVANQLPSSGESAAFKEFAWRFVNIIAQALVALGKTPRYQDIEQYMLVIDPLLLAYAEQTLPPLEKNWRERVSQAAQQLDKKTLPPHLKNRDRFMLALVNVMDTLKLNDAIYTGLRSMFYYDQTYFQKITASLSPLFAKLTSGQSAPLISPDYSDVKDKRPLFDWLQVIRGKKIVYVGLDALSDSTVSTAVGNSMFADLCSTVGQIYKFGVQDDIACAHPKKTFFPVNLYSDEFNELAGDEFIPLANKGGGAGLQLTVATQTGSDVLARLGSVAKAHQVFGNFNTLLCLRVIEERTARLLLDKLPQRIQVTQRQAVSSAQAVNITTGKHFTSQTNDHVLQKEVPLLSTEDVMQLPKGHAFCLLDGGQLYKVRFPLPKNDMQGMPDTIEGILATLQNKSSD